ncbi:PVC-type heme-binding CxxCH protein [Planctomicrobium sp. SH661]|uniref:PVC-type heme-binding CxxCH protein n=1 Tax=Planctomicrobium sp. SH661 TaxID=3448124 RepID=UPI003F5B6575
MRLLTFACLTCALTVSVLRADEPEAGFKPIFNGTSLDGWKGDEKYWRVADGAIIGESTAENPLDHNTFLVWDRGDVDDFELRLKFRLSGTPSANSGIQFRGSQADDGHVIGYQADMDRAGGYVGTLHDEAARGGLALRGQKTIISESGEMKREQVADAEELLKKVNLDDWNDYSITAQGNHIILKINGHVTAEVIDNDPKGLDRIGKLALQVHSGPPMKIEFKDIRLKRLPLADGWKKVVFVAGRPSHAYFAHEHNAGCLLLAKALNSTQQEHGLPVLSTVYLNGWPKDVTAFDNADTVVAYCDGGAGHFLNDHLEDFDHDIMPRGVGLVCLHYGVETVPGAPGDHFLKWIGGFFEPHWSVNPHWVAKFDKFPDHPISRGVQPFEIQDEWYYHMRFVPDMIGVTPILTALPPRETLSRPDGPHSGNPAVRAAVLERQEPQHMAWAYDRTDKKGRGFGFTGGHDHVNWQHDDFRKLVLNAIVWTAHGEVPKDGVVSPTPSQDEMLKNMDEPAPEGFKFQPRPRKAAAAAGAKDQALAKSGGPKPLFSSPVISTSTPGHAVEVSADITGAQSLFLFVNDGGDGYACDWADWVSPRLVVDPADPSKGELLLTDLRWKAASAAWGGVHVNKNANGESLVVHGRPVPNGIGTHANSLIEYELPEGHKFTRFLATAAIDEGGSRQGGSSIQFRVYTERPSAQALGSGVGSHESADAVEQLEVHPDLNATLFASEPMMTNPASIDIDHLGRVWVCEAINYRPFANKDVIGEHAADRILILEDTDGDAAADKSTVFYEGADVDAAQGILVLPTADGKGTRALISAGDKIFFLIDDDGDLKADRQELLFTGIDGKQHDHGVHAVHFGPDGKLYFNFGNAGGTIKDKNGQPITDKAGNVVDSTRKPYQEGMVFRCNLDGSDFETLAWNFRNNWEACVSSYGTIWQSDNDDDGNRGVRINYVMEYGNYGYKDELTGAGWQTPRTNLEAEIPHRHWHLNDPGVIPNFVQTGAGAPTGICLYEGSLLPAELRGAPIHCDAGPNICRAYVPTVDGAGYTGKTVDLLNGVHNKWFRPSDVCVAPDGSLLVADWYDPGVGGHRMMDAAHGRIFRVAPKSAAKYVAPGVDVSTAAKAVETLQSPNMSARYLAWNALMAMGPAADEELVKLRKSSDPIMQARAIWLLGKLKLDPARKLAHLKSGLTDANPELRVTSIRLLRQLMNEVSFDDIHDSINIEDSSPAVRREMLIALREVKPEWIPAGMRNDFVGKAWSQLAQQYDGKDRWYLEALGIGAHGHWDECLATWISQTGNQWLTTPAGRDIVWRSRASQTASLLAQIILNPATPAEELPRDLRALDFQLETHKQNVVIELAFSDSKLDPARLAFIRTEALSRLNSQDLSTNPARRAVVEQLLASNPGTATYISLVTRFNLKDHFKDLLTLAQTDPHSQLAVDAIRSLFDKGEQSLVLTSLTSGDREQAGKTFAALATAGDQRSFDALVQLLKDDQQPLWIRQGAVKALAGSAPGAQLLLGMARKKEYPQQLQQAFAAALTTSSVPQIRGEALTIFPPPPGKDAAPLPSIPELVKLSGNAEHGKVIFNTTGTCNKCHQVNGIGQDVGPNLSEIGKKLAKPAFFESILFPSAAISHGYENWLFLTDDGQIYTGLLVSETDQEVKVKDDKGIIRTVPLSRVEERKKQDVSLMPADLQRLLTAEELVDVVEYLTTLRERKL